MCFFPLFVILRAVSDCNNINRTMGKRHKKNRNSRNQHKKVIPLLKILNVKRVVFNENDVETNNGHFLNIK